MQAFIDGKAQPNPGIGCWGFVIKMVNGDLVGYGKSEKDKVTNNQAEYGALVNLVRHIKTMELPDGVEFNVHTDSELLYNQMTVNAAGKPNYETNDKILAKMQETIKGLMKESGHNFKLTWVPREKNEQADALTNKAYEELQPGATKVETIAVKAAAEPKKEEAEDNNVSNEKTTGSYSGKAYHNRFECKFDGRLVRDPEVRVTSTGNTVAKFTVCRNRGEQSPEFHDCVAFGQMAEHIGKTFRKGNAVFVDVKDQSTSTFETKEEPPVKKIRVEWIINAIYGKFIPKAKEAKADDGNNGGNDHEGTIE